jgi:DNA-binding IclR family transcriptional regulator
MAKTARKTPAEKSRAAKDRQFVTALARGLDILRAFTPRHPVLGNSEIAQRTHLPKPTVTRLTYTLTQLGYLNYSPESGKYSLSVGVLALGYSFLASQDIRAIARPMMQEFADYARAAVCLAARDQPHMVFLEVCQGNPTFQMRLEVGARVPYGMTALGRAYHCGLPEEARAAMLEEHRKTGRKEDWEGFRASFEKAVREYQKYGGGAADFARPVEDPRPHLRRSALRDDAQPHLRGDRPAPDPAARPPLRRHRRQFLRENAPAFQ